MYPNMYIMLQGLPATRKNSAIDMATHLLKEAKFNKLAPARMSRQSFLDEMYQANVSNITELTIDQQLDMLPGDEPASEFCIHAPEFVDFIGQNDKDYLMLITNLWDNLSEYENPKISKKSVKVIKPTINLLGGATPENLNIAFPASTMDTGTLSRFLFIYATRTSEAILIPEAPCPHRTKVVVDQLKAIRELHGVFTFSKETEASLNFLYEASRKNGLQDPRFTYYNGRRMTHLWKLSMIMAAMRLSMEISSEDVLMANTILATAEYSMPKALGHFGRSKQSAIMHDISEWLLARGIPTITKDIYKRFASDFSRETDFLLLLQDMQNSNKLTAVSKDDKFIGFTVQEERFPKWLDNLMVYEELTKQELETIGVSLT